MREKAFKKKKMADVSASMQSVLLYQTYSIYLTQKSLLVIIKAFE